MNIDESWFINTNNAPTRVVAGGIVCRVDNGTVYVALIRDEVNQDHYALPKGGVEEGEEIEEAARREIEEEAGFTELINLGFLDTTERLSFSKKNWSVGHYYLYQTTQVTMKPTDTEKDFSVAWFPLYSLPPMFWPEQLKLIEDNRALIKQKVV